VGVVTTRDESMRTRWRPLAGVLVVVGACSGPVTARLEPSSEDGPADAAPSDAGANAQVDAGAPRRADGGRPVPTSGVGPAGFEGLDPVASLLFDGSPAGGMMPPRLDGDGPWTDAVPGGMPQVLDQGGPVVAAPVFQSITFANYDLTAYVDEFVAKIGSSSYWRQVVTQYGVGPAGSAPPVHIATGAPANIDDVQIETWLAAQITAGAPFASPGAGTVYVVFYPSTSSVTFQGDESCFTMGAYHNNMVVGGVNVPYAVVPECSWATRTALQATTGAASHEMIESVTDPLPVSATPAYLGVDPQHQVFQVVLGGGEVADMCAQWPSSFFVPAGFPYMVQRAWSNSAVVAGLDPCQPELAGETFFNAVPVLGDTVSISDGTNTYSTLGARIAVGASRVLDVNLYSEADVGPWTVQALNVPLGGSNLDFAWDRATGNNGDTLHLTVTVNSVGDTYGGQAFLLESTLDSETNYWLGYVAQ
jgi:hypothetical protein